MSAQNKFWFYPDFIEEGWTLLCVSPEEWYDGCLMVLKREALTILKTAGIKTNNDGDIATGEVRQAQTALIKAGWKRRYIPVGP